MNESDIIFKLKKLDYQLYEFKVDNIDCLFIVDPLDFPDGFHLGGKRKEVLKEIENNLFV